MRSLAEVGIVGRSFQRDPPRQTAPVFPTLFMRQVNALKEQKKWRSKKISAGARRVTPQLFHLAERSSHPQRNALSESATVIKVTALDNKNYFLSSLSSTVPMLIKIKQVYCTLLL